MFGLTRAAPAPDPSPTAVIGRVKLSREKLKDAELRTPQIREQISAIEKTIAEAIGVQMATGADRGTIIAELREQRTVLQNEIEQLGATAATIRSGLAAAEREEARAKAAQQRAEANAARKDLVSRLGRAIELLEELWTIDNECLLLVEREWRAWRAESLEREKIGDGHAATPPHSEAPSAGDVLDPSFAALQSSAGGRFEAFHNGIARIKKVIANAEAATAAK